MKIVNIQYLEGNELLSDLYWHAHNVVVSVLSVSENKNLAIELEAYKLRNGSRSEHSWQNPDLIFVVFFYFELGIVSAQIFL